MIQSTESERDEQRSREIDANDVMDVSFLSVTIPYFDIIVTEQFWVDLAKRNRLDQAYCTILLTDLAGVEQHLSGHFEYPFQIKSANDSSTSIFLGNLRIR